MRLQLLKNFKDEYEMTVHIWDKEKKQWVPIWSLTQSKPTSVKITGTMIRVGR